MDQWINALMFTPWAWFILALLLAALEIVAPGAFMIWLAGAAFITGAATLLLPIGWELQLVIFAVASIGSVLKGLQYLRRNPPRSSDELLNNRSARLVGQVVTVVEPIVDGQGRVQVADSPWLASGPDAPAGTRLRIRAVEGSRLLVEPLSGNRPEDL